MLEEVSNEIISAEVEFSPQDEMSNNTLPEEYQQELDEINEELEKYSNRADRLDYLNAIASGILCGVLNAQVAEVSSRILKSENLDLPGKGKELISYLLQEVENDRGKISMAGMLCCVLSNCMSIKADDIFIKNEETENIEFNPVNAFRILGGSIVSALIEWLTADKDPRDIDRSDFPESVKIMLNELNNRPEVRDFLKNPRIPEINTETLNRLGVPALFIDIVEPGLPKVNQSLIEAKNKAEEIIQSHKPESKNYNIPMAAAEKTGNQALAMFTNDFLVRTFYFIRHLMIEMEKCRDIESVDWSKVIPFANKTVRRMLSIAALTFAAADMTKAAVRAAVESGGDAALSARKYTAKINVIGAGKALLTVVRDAARKRKDAGLKRERQESLEDVSPEQAEAILDYQNRMETVMEEYLAEDLQEILTETDETGNSPEVKNSDRGIRGLFKISRILGKRPHLPRFRRSNEQTGA